MFLLGSLNPNSPAAESGGWETGNCSVSLFMLNNKKLNGLKSASQREIFRSTFSSLNLSDGDEHKNWMRLFFPPYAPPPHWAWQSCLGPLGWPSLHGTVLATVPSQSLRSPHQELSSSLPLRKSGTAGKNCSGQPQPGPSAPSARELSAQPVCRNFPIVRLFLSSFLLLFYIPIPGLVPVFVSKLWDGMKSAFSSPVEPGGVYKQVGV